MKKKEVHGVFQKLALKFIRNESDAGMYCVVTNEALFLATAGYLEDANRILETLWSFKWPHSEDCWMPDQSLTVLWATAGKYPENIPFEIKSLDAIEISHREYGTNRAVYQPSTPNWRDQKYDRFVECLMLARPVGGVMPSNANELDSLAGLTQILEGTQNNELYLFESSCLGSELAARNGLTEKSTELCQLWARKSVQYQEGGCNFVAMASNRHVAPLLLKGVLAEALEVNAAEAKEYADRLIREASARMKQGRKLRYGKWTWEKLLKAISSRAIKTNRELFSKQVIRQKWLGFSAAAPETIAAVEQRLGVKLPSDYVQFLAVSNGFMAPSQMVPDLFPTEQLGRFKDLQTDATLLEILQMGVPGQPEIDLKDAIQISPLGSGGGEMVFMVPPENEAGRWQVYFFEAPLANWSVYPSFRHFMEGVYENLEIENAI